MENGHVTIDDLAVMIKDVFDGATVEFRGVNNDIDGLKSDLGELKEGQERIELRLDNVADRFEFVALEKKRVEKLEKVVKV